MQPSTPLATLSTVPRPLSDWLNEYRQFDADEVTRPVADAVDDWEEEELLAPADRVRDTSPRWLERAERVGYARATQI
jgi:hypothetical protein